MKCRSPIWNVIFSHFVLVFNILYGVVFIWMGWSYESHFQFKLDNIFLTLILCSTHPSQWLCVCIAGLFISFITYCLRKWFAIVFFSSKFLGMLFSHYWSRFENNIKYTLNHCECVHMCWKLVAYYYLICCYSTSPSTMAYAARTIVQFAQELLISILLLHFYFITLYIGSDHSNQQNTRINRLFFSINA